MMNETEKKYSDLMLERSSKPSLKEGKTVELSLVCDKPASVQPPHELLL
jgi:hypothetical protein